MVHVFEHMSVVVVVVAADVLVLNDLVVVVAAAVVVEAEDVVVATVESKASLSVARHASASASVLCGQLTEKGTAEPGNTSLLPGSSRNACCLAVSSTSREESTTSYDQPTAAVAVSRASIATVQMHHAL